MKVKKEVHTLRTFTNDLVLILEDSLKGIDVLMAKAREFRALAEFKINEKAKMLLKNMKMEDQNELSVKSGFQIGEKRKHFSIITSMNLYVISK